MTKRLWETDKQFDPPNEELLRFGYAPGNYMIKCRSCTNQVTGVDKLARCCRNCAVDLWRHEHMSDHWLDNILPTSHSNGRETFEPINHGPAEMPQRYPPIRPDPETEFKAGGIQVYSGGAAWPLKMHDTIIDIFDIAHALSMKVRFTGHCTEDYKIAQHCCHVHDLVPKEDRLEALLHDASEYVLPDVASPLKHSPEIRPWFKPIEDAAETAIARAFNMRFPYPPSVKAADNAMVLFERTKILLPAKYPWMVWTVPGEPAYIPNFKVWTWKQAKLEFLKRANALGLI